MTYTRVVGSASCKHGRLSLVLLALIVPACATSLAGQGRWRIPERGNAIIMDDGFEYAVTDYGLGKIQVRPTDSADSLSPQVFWVKFRIVNRAEHLILNPKYFVSRVIDNWGNSYSLQDPITSYIDGKIIGGTSPIPENEKRGGFFPAPYKPGDLSWGLKIIPAGEFVSGITELRIYLANVLHGEAYFKIARPLVRQKDLLREQSDPEPSELQIASVKETLIPAQVPVGKQKQ